ncbi:MAG TPA: hypothetical protein VKS82_21510 [Streptosporangiaceae bacterium]|nr:hypothetical protein [Streptosporangiaceae bacterium]
MTETQRADIPAAQPGLADRSGVGRLLSALRRILLPLFPHGPRPVRRTRRQAVLRTAATVAVLAAGAWVSLIRQAGTPSWQTVWSEDAWLFLPRAVHGPGAALFRQYAGYLQLVPQLIADGVARLPLRDASVGFAIAGALVASSMAIFVFHASRGHIRQPALRALLSCSVLLLPTALIEIANNGVDSPWYLMFGFFWALLWRPRSAGGKAVVALIAFAAMSSQVANLLFLPMVAARVIALPRLREHAVTVGWLAGIGFQSIELFDAAKGHPLGPASGAIHFYGQHVLVPVVFGWRWALQVQAAIGIAATIAIAGGVLAAVVAWALWRGNRQNRAFTVAALTMGVILSIFLVMYRHLIGTEASSDLWVPGGRYATMGILLLDCIAIAGVGAYLRRKSTVQHLARRAIAIALLVAGLGTGWATSFRYHNVRSKNPPWSKTYIGYQQQVLDHPNSLNG